MADKHLIIRVAYLRDHRNAFPLKGVAQNDFFFGGIYMEEGQPSW